MKAPEQPGRAGSPAMWLMVVSMGLLFVPLFLLSGAIKETQGPLQAELATLQGAMQATPVVPADVEALNAQLVETMGQTAALAQARDALSAAHRNVPDMIGLLIGYPPSKLTLTQISQSDTGWIIGGKAQDEGEVLEYVAMLRAYPPFESVVIQSVTLLAASVEPSGAMTAPSEGTPEAPNVVPQFVPGSRAVEFMLALTWREVEAS